MLGLVTYGIVVCVGMSLLARARFPRWYWLTFNAGTLFGTVFCGLADVPVPVPDQRPVPVVLPGLGRSRSSCSGT
ncbi:hypothetical protein GCM10023238_27680 [Streptomyces heliomycini]